MFCCWQQERKMEWGLLTWRNTSGNQKYPGSKVIREGELYLLLMKIFAFGFACISLIRNIALVTVIRYLTFLLNSPEKYYKNGFFLVAVKLRVFCKIKIVGYKSSLQFRKDIEKYQSMLEMTVYTMMKKNI